MSSAWRPPRGAASSTPATARRSSRSTSAIAEYMALIDPDTAFWALVARQTGRRAVSDGDLVKAYRRKAAQFADEMHTLRFGLKPSAVYFNPTERCNLNCTLLLYPARDAPPRAAHVGASDCSRPWRVSSEYFDRPVPKGVAAADRLPRRRAAAQPRGGLRRHRAYRRRVPLRHSDQRHAARRLGHRVPDRRDVSIGISLDAARPAIADRTRSNWDGQGRLRAGRGGDGRLRGYAAGASSARSPARICGT